MYSTSFHLPRAVPSEIVIFSPAYLWDSQIENFNIRHKNSEAGTCNQSVGRFELSKKTSKFIYSIQLYLENFLLQRRETCIWLWFIPTKQCLRCWIKYNFFSYWLGRNNPQYGKYNTSFYNRAPKLRFNLTKWLNSFEDFLRQIPVKFLNSARQNFVPRGWQVLAAVLIIYLRVWHFMI